MELLNNISLFIGIWVAIYGIDSWRREHRGRRQVDLAEETLALFYEAKDAIAHMRSPIGYSNETDDVEKGKDESEASYGARKSASVVFKRYDQHVEVFNKIHAMRYRFMAQFGADRSRPFDELHKVVREILVAARMLANLWARDHFRNEEAIEKHHESVQKYEKIFWDSYGDEDPINPRLNEIISSIEKSCREIIEAKSTLYSILDWRRTRRR
jgi:hypothetical protein